MQDKKTFNAIVAVIVCSLIIVTAAVSYSFLDVSTPSNNDNRTNISASTESNLELVYTDCAESNQEDCANISKDLGLGESVTKTFQIKNDTQVNSQYTIYFKELQSTFKNEELVYKIENIDTGEILIDTTSVPFHRMPEINIPIKENIKIEKNTTHNYKMTVTFLKKDYNQNENKDAIYSMKISIIPKENPNFALAATTDEGIFKMEDDIGTSYYYRGAVTNNYVKFGKNKTGQDMYWRIIRFNGDGSVRMQYDGAGTADDPNYTYTRGFALTDQVWNTNYDDAKYVGWMFGGAQGTASSNKAQAQANETPSEIKTAIDTWYKENIYDTGWHEYIADEIFCNDRSTPGQSETGVSADTGLGYGNNYTAYGAIAREGFSGTANYESPKPSFVCPQGNDKFTVSSDAGGNGKLTYPVGLITADEIVASGSGKYGAPNRSYYLYKGSWYWSFSPSNVNSMYAYVLYVNSSGGLSYTNVDSSGAVAPVINIKSEYVEKMVGDGTAGNPYLLPNA